MILVTAANRDYIARITPYLHTIAEFGHAFDRRVLVTVGCQVEMPGELAAIEAVPLPAARALGHTGNFCIQQGCHLEVLGAADDEVVVFTDGDVRMQRPLAFDEAAWMRALPPHTIALGYNAGPHDTLHQEASRIALDGDGRGLFEALLHRKVYNVGVIVTRIATYRRIYTRYVELWPEFAPHTTHYAANQFLMCACIHELGLRVWELPGSVHTHGCFGLPDAATEDEQGSIWTDGELVLFRHHWKC